MEFRKAAQSVYFLLRSWRDGQSSRAMGSSGPHLMFAGSGVVPSRLPVSVCTVSRALSPVMLCGSRTEQLFSPAVGGRVVSNYRNCVCHVMP